MAKLVREWTGEQARKRRGEMGLTQAQFWERFQVGQAGGSRYEGGRTIPKPVQALLTIGLGTDLQAKETVDRTVHG